MTIKDFWDPLNKAAILITIMTGIPAFLSFVGMSFVSGVLLGVFSVSSLTFALFRIRTLNEKSQQLEVLNKQERVLFERFNKILVSLSEENSGEQEDLKVFVTKVLDNLASHIETQINANTVVSMREMKSNLDIIQAAASSKHETKPKTINIEQESPFKQIWYSFGNVFTPQSNDYENWKNLSTEFYNTVAIFPILAEVIVKNSNTPSFQHWGFLVVDVKKKKKIPKNLESLFLKYSHLFFLLFTSISNKLDTAQQSKCSEPKKLGR